MLKRFSVLLLISCLVLCSLSAFPGREKTRLAEVAPEPTLTDTGSVVKNESDAAENELKEPEKSLINETVQKYEDMGTIKGSDKDELLSIIIAQDEDIAESDAEINRLADRVDELEAENARQADAIAREQGSKAYARLTGSVGFENGVDDPSFWLGGAVGARFGSGLLFDVGVEHKVGTLSGLSLTSRIENMRLSTSIGWEW